MKSDHPGYWLAGVIFVCVTVGLMFDKYCDMEIETTKVMVEAKYERTGKFGSITWSPSR